MREFLLILAAALGCALLGGGFGYAIGLLSPEFIDEIVGRHIGQPERMGTVLGLLTGLLLGAGTMAFGLLVSAFRAWATRVPAARVAPVEKERGSILIKE